MREVPWNALAGIGGFMLGHFTKPFFIDPVLRLKATIRDVAYALTNEAQVYANPGVHSREREQETSEALRSLSSRLAADVHSVPMYRITAFVFRLPGPAKVEDAAKHLRALSNGFTQGRRDPNQAILNCYQAQHARIALGISIPKGEWLDPDRELHHIRAQDHGGRGI